MELYDVYEKETGKSCTTTIKIKAADVGSLIEYDSLNYVKWLESKLQNKSYKSDYCRQSKKRENK